MLVWKDNQKDILGTDRIRYWVLSKNLEIFESLKDQAKKGDPQGIFVQKDLK